MSDRTPRYAGTQSVRSGLEVDRARVADWLQTNVEGYSGPLTIVQFRGGQSNPTYKLTTPVHTYVLRRKPPGALTKGAHAIEREYRIISALRTIGFPVASPYALCTDHAVIGTPFYVMEMVEGRIFWDSSFVEVSRDKRGCYFDAMNATIARLHSIDPARIGLSDFGRTGNYCERQIGRWSAQYRAEESAGRNIHMEKLMEWLAANIPKDEDSTLVHGDFRTDNMIFHPREPKVIAVLDWELSTLGHPLSDFAYHLMMYRLPPAIIGGLNGRDLQALGIPTEAEYVSAYCRRTRRSRIDNMDFYVAFNMFKFAAILHGIRGRIHRGTAASAHAKSMAAHFEALTSLAWMQVAHGANP